MLMNNMSARLLNDDDGGALIAYKHDDFQNYIACADSCLDCPHFHNHRFDVCGAEGSTGMLDCHPKKEFLIMPTTFNNMNSVDISTRPKRRRAVSTVVDALSRILSAEMAYIDRIPPNLHRSDAYVAADESADMLIEAIEILSNTY